MRLHSQRPPARSQVSSTTDSGNSHPLAIGRFDTVFYTAFLFLVFTSERNDAIVVLRRESERDGDRSNESPSSSTTGTTK